MCVFTAADIVSVCHELLGNDKVIEMFSQLVNCLKFDSLQENALKGITLIALHETTDLRARLEERVKGQTAQIGGLIPILRSMSSR